MLSSHFVNNLITQQTSVLNNPSWAREENLCQKTGKYFEVSDWEFFFWVVPKYWENLNQSRKQDQFSSLLDSTCVECWGEQGGNYWDHASAVLLSSHPNHIASAKWLKKGPQGTLTLLQLIPCLQWLEIDFSHQLVSTCDSWKWSD